jgi:protein-disulfide isomerase
MCPDFRFFRILALLAVAPFASPASASAQASPCESLGAAKKEEAAKLMAVVYPHDCCDQTLDRCLEAAPSRLVRRLAGEVCRRVAGGEDGEAIKREMLRRAESMLGSGKAAKIDEKDLVWAGATDAKVSVVAYFCTRCPLCAKSLPALHEDVTRGALKGKVRLGARLFPLKDHKGSLEGALAVLAAGAQGKPWPYVLKVLGSFEQFAVDKLRPWAAGIGLDADAFARSMGDPQTRKKLVESKKEGIRNGVRSTPAHFISGKRYTGEVSIEALRDAILEEVDRAEGKLCDP